MERQRFYSNILSLENGVVKKQSQWPVDKRALTIIKSVSPSFLPKILDFDEYTITYEYIEGIAVGTWLKQQDATAQDIVEIYTKINDIWKEFLSISKEYCNGKMLYHNDLHLWNMIYKDGEIILTDVDSIIISDHVKMQTTHSYLFHQMEEILYARVQR
jgi:thiamine kinase-like enzyme